MEIIERNEKTLKFNSNVSFSKYTDENDESLEDFFFWNDLRMFPDIIEGGSKYIYIFDDQQGIIYYGLNNSSTFTREPDRDVERELLKEY